VFLRVSKTIETAQESEEITDEIQRLCPDFGPEIAKVPSLRHRHLRVKNSVVHKLRTHFRVKDAEAGTECGVHV
jgi:hypothetical protein